MKGRVDKKVKSDTLPPARVGEEIKAKFIAMCEKAGKSQSSVLRELVDKGQVEVIYNGKELMRYVAEVHKKFNQYSFKVADDIQAVKKDIQQIISCLQRQGIESEDLRIYLARASYTLDNFQKQYSEQRIISEQILLVRDVKHGHI